MWSEIKMINGKSRRSQCQGSVETANHDIESFHRLSISHPSSKYVLFTTWMTDTQTNK